VLIRGFSARNDIYVDGARDVGLISRDAFNTEVVEVREGSPRRQRAAAARPADRSIW
jgi:outer membrane receptor for monomeric catechols